MNNRDYLLVLVMEEASEIGQAASKCLRFTPEHAYYESSNLGMLRTELRDLVTVLSLLEKELDTKFDMTVCEGKLKRIEKYMNISREMGTLV